MKDERSPRSRSQLAAIAMIMPSSRPDLAQRWRFLAVDPNQTAEVRPLVDEVVAAIRGVDFSKRPQLLP
jgi:hypothetical protein